MQPQRSPSTATSWSPEMLHDLKEFLDGQTFVVNPEGAFDFSGGHDSKTPLHVIVKTRFPESSSHPTQYNLSLSFQKGDAGRDAALPLNGFTIGVEAAEEADSHRIIACTNSRERNTLTFGPLLTDQPYQFSVCIEEQGLSSGGTSFQLEKISLPERGTNQTKRWALGQVLERCRVLLSQ